jgi:thioredoxin reductase
MRYDVIVVGGSYAGMAAAMQLARARRAVMVIDAGQRRNRFADASHGFLGQDGRAPAVIAAEARAQLLAYPTVTWLDATATRARESETGFVVELADGAAHESNRLILATGVVDELPAIPGLRERWGKSVFHCPYCHGYELDNGQLGVLATGPLAMHQAMLVPDWGQTTLFTNSAFEVDSDQAALLAARGVTIETACVTAITGERTDVTLCDGRTVPLAGLFTAPRTRMASPLAEQLQCTFEDGAFGPVIQIDAMKETSVRGVFACGDAARATGTVTFAVADGATAGIAAHRSLIFQ